MVEDGEEVTVVALSVADRSLLLVSLTLLCIVGVAQLVSSWGSDG